MVVAVVVPARKGFGPIGIYNRQEVGLAKALADLGHTAYVVRAVAESSEADHATQRGAIVHEIRRRAFALGSHGIFSFSFLERLKLDAMIVLGSDLQLSVPALHAWCKRRSVEFWPYIGTMTTNKWRKNPISDWFAFRNIKVYKQSLCLAKTPAMEQFLRNMGVTNIRLLPVGLDIDGLRQFDPSLRCEARKVLKLDENERVISYVGALSRYKKPLEVLDALAMVNGTVGRTRLVAVGDGPLLSQFEAKILNLGLGDRVTHIKRLDQKDMYLAYSCSDIYLNLNEAEIFGMSIMEALYYRIPVVAVAGPGPSFLLRPGVDGELVSSSDRADVSAAIARVFERIQTPHRESEGVEDRFSWSSIVQKPGFPWLSGDSAFRGGEEWQQFQRP